MNEKVDKGLSVFTRRTPVAPLPEVPLRETKLEPKIDVKVSPQPSQKQVVKQQVKVELLDKDTKTKETKFSFYGPDSSFNDLEDHLNQIKRKTGWRINKKEYFCALMEAYVGAHQRIPDAKNYVELVDYFKKILKD